VAKTTESQDRPRGGETDTRWVRQRKGIERIARTLTDRGSVRGTHAGRNEEEKVSSPLPERLLRRGKAEGKKWRDYFIGAMNQKKNTGACPSILTPPPKTTGREKADAFYKIDGGDCWGNFRRPTKVFLSLKNWEGMRGDSKKN